MTGIEDLKYSEIFKENARLEEVLAGKNYE